MRYDKASFSYVLLIASTHTHTHTHAFSWCRCHRKVGYRPIPTRRFSSYLDNLGGVPLEGGGGGGEGGSNSGGVGGGNDYYKMDNGSNDGYYVGSSSSPSFEAMDGAMPSQIMQQFQNIGARSNKAKLKKEKMDNDDNDINTFQSTDDDNDKDEVGFANNNESLTPNESIDNIKDYTSAVNNEINDDKIGNESLISEEVASDSRDYTSAMSALQTSKTDLKNQLKTYNRERSSDKLKQLTQRTEERTRRVADEIKQKLNQAQLKVDETVEQASDVILEYIELEKGRQIALEELLESLTLSIEVKIAALEADNKIRSGLSKARTNVKSTEIGRRGIVTQLDILLQEKETRVSAIEEALLVNLQDCVRELESIKLGSVRRQRIMENTLSRIIRSELSSTDPYDWSDVEALELVANDVIKEVQGAEAKISTLQDR